jgi:hypothetical protein
MKGASVPHQFSPVIEPALWRASACVRIEPFRTVFDEVGYYCVNGMAIMAAQGRSLGFSLVFATQDIPAILRENDKEAKSIIANTTNKVSSCGWKNWS